VGGSDAGNTRFTFTKRLKESPGNKCIRKEKKERKKGRKEVESKKESQKKEKKRKREKEKKRKREKEKKRRNEDGEGKYYPALVFVSTSPSIPTS
jgi:hypothetical protein